MWRQQLPFELVALLCAKDSVGLEESPNNTGPAIKILQRAAGIPTRSPWCAAFVNWCAEYASVIKNVESPLETVPNQGYVQSYYKWAERSGRLIMKREVFPGVLFLKWSESRQRYAHIGFVSGIDFSSDKFYTVEGNTNKLGEREGRYVLASVRSMSTGVYVFVDWTKGLRDANV